MNEQEMKLFGKPDWRWVWIGYCFFVVLHLLPTMILTLMSRSGMGLGWDIGTLLWMFFGIAIVGAYIGFKSKGVTVLEPAISGALYTLTLVVSIRKLWDLPFGWRPLLSAFGSMLAAFAIALVSAWLGELLQARRQTSEVRDQKSEVRG